MNILKIRSIFFLYVFLLILSSQTCYAFENNKSATLKIEKFFKNLITLEANFIQVSPSGNISNGKIYLDLPGMLRIDYENPNNLQSTVLSGGEDKLLKIWDRNSG